MLIIWGLRVFFRTIGQGMFHCPKCGGDRQYRLREGRRWFTIFFIPVIPLNKVGGQHVQCLTCKTRYQPQVLQLPTAAQMQAAIPAGLRAAAATMLRAGDEASAAARQRAIQVIVAGGAQGYDEAALDAEIALAPEIRAARVAEVGGQLTADAKEWFLAEIIRIGMADGPLNEGERDAALAVGQGLGMTQAQVIGVVALTEQASTSE